MYDLENWIEDYNQSILDTTEENSKVYGLPIGTIPMEYADDIQGLLDKTDVNMLAKEYVHVDLEKQFSETVIVFDIGDVDKYFILIREHLKEIKTSLIMRITDVKEYDTYYYDYSFEYNNKTITVGGNL